MRCGGRGGLRCADLCAERAGGDRISQPHQGWRGGPFRLTPRAGRIRGEDKWNDERSSTAIGLGRERGARLVGEPGPARRGLGGCGVVRLLRRRGRQLVHRMGGQQQSADRCPAAGTPAPTLHSRHARLDRSAATAADGATLRSSVSRRGHRAPCARWFESPPTRRLPRASSG